MVCLGRQTVPVSKLWKQKYDSYMSSRKVRSSSCGYKDIMELLVAAIDRYLQWWKNVADLLIFRPRCQLFLDLFLISRLKTLFGMNEENNPAYDEKVQATASMNFLGARLRGVMTAIAHAEDWKANTVFVVIALIPLVWLRLSSNSQRGYDGARKLKEMRIED